MQEGVMVVVVPGRRTNGVVYGKRQAVAEEERRAESAELKAAG